MNSDRKKPLFQDFPEISTAEWEEKIRADLNGKDYHKKLFRKTDEGIEIKPFYRQEDVSRQLDYLENAGSLRPGHGAPNGWIVCQDLLQGTDAVLLNSKIKTALNGGAKAIRINAGDFALWDHRMVADTLNGLPVDAFHLLFKGNGNPDRIYDSLIKLCQDRGFDPACLTGSLGADPLGGMMRSGRVEGLDASLARLVKKVRKQSPSLRVTGVNGAHIHNAGSTLTEELAFTLSMAIEYMDYLTSKGVSAADAARSLQLDLASGPDYFMEVAKLRAARLLWASICEGYGLPANESGVTIHSTSSEWNLTLYDPYVNLLRSTSEAMSSVLGGADLVSVLPFDYPCKGTADFSGRIARNVQIILREEAYLDKVADPAAGSYYIESLTDAIAEKAWDLFRKVESMGGFTRALGSGWIREKVTGSRKLKIERASSGRDKILGTNAFPDFNETILDKLKNDPDWKTGEIDEEPARINSFRIASMFEEVRMQTERSPKRPAVFLFKYGNPAWRTARAGFSGNFFACAGYRIFDPPAFESVEEGIVAAGNAGADIVVLCSDDDTYESLAPAVHEALKDSSLIVVAGNPASSAEELRKAGIEHFIHTKTDLLETLKQFNQILL